MGWLVLIDGIALAIASIGYFLILWQRRRQSLQVVVTFAAGGFGALAGMFELVGMPSYLGLGAAAFVTAILAIAAYFVVRTGPPRETTFERLHSETKKKVMTRRAGR